jgi:RNA polymerase sigma-70 factor (ECF subfamily)
MITQARDGDGEVLGKLLETFRPLLLQRSRSVWGTVPGVGIGSDDLVQDTLLRAVCRFPQFEGNTGPELGAWLLRILDSRIEKARREADGRHHDVLFDDFLESERIAAEQLSPGSEFRVREEKHLVEQAITWLTDRYRKVIELRRDTDQNFAEIGDKLGCSEGAARKLWQRAVHQLQRMLGAKKKRP